MEDKLMDYNLLFKVVLIGDTGVGKTNLLSRFTRNEFHLMSESTIGVNLGSRIVEVYGTPIMVKVCDMAGEEQHQMLINQSFSQSCGVLLIYDITNWSTFESINKWLTQLRDHDENMAIMLVGNKCDLAHSRAVPTNEARNFAIRSSLPFIETSALDSTHVDSAFQQILIEINRNVFYKQNMKKDSTSSPPPKPIPPPIDITKTDKKDKKFWKCC